MFNEEVFVLADFLVFFHSCYGKEELNDDDDDDDNKKRLFYSVET
jgi:hypothetical protein